MIMRDLQKKVYYTAINLNIRLLFTAALSAIDVTCRQRSFCQNAEKLSNIFHHLFSKGFRSIFRKNWDKTENLKDSGQYLNLASVANGIGFERKQLLLKDFKYCPLLKMHPLLPYCIFHLKMQNSNCPEVIFALSDNFIRFFLLFFFLIFETT